MLGTVLAYCVCMNVMLLMPSNLEKLKIAQNLLSKLTTARWMNRWKGTMFRYRRTAGKNIHVDMVHKISEYLHDKKNWE